MKNNPLFSPLIVLLLAAQLFSCKKGDTGPAGTQGPQGSSGNTILSGTGSPSSSLGVVGDFYLDVTALMLYGPKTSSGWGSGVLLKGAQGNANVKVDTFSIASADWKYSSIYWFTTGNGSSQGYSSKYFDHAQAALSSDLLKTGQISIYATTNISFETTTWTPLPYTFTENNAGAYGYNYAYNLTEGNLKIHFFFSRGTGTIPTLSTYAVPAMRIKLVMVAGTVVSQIRELTHQSSPMFQLVTE